MSHVFQFILEKLGMTPREQLVTFAALAILLFALYAGKLFATQKVYSVLYLLLALAFCVFMTTDDEATRITCGVAMGGAVLSLFVWYFVTAAAGSQSSRGDE